MVTFCHTQGVDAVAGGIEAVAGGLLHFTRAVHASARVVSAFLPRGTCIPATRHPHSDHVAPAFVMGSSFLAFVSFGAGNARLFLAFVKFGTGKGLLVYRMDARCRRGAPGVRDAFSEALCAKNRLLVYRMDIRCKKQASPVRNGYSVPETPPTARNAFKVSDIVNHISLTALKVSTEIREGHFFIGCAAFQEKNAISAV